jgi:hypothetical protein
MLDDLEKLGCLAVDVKRYADAPQNGYVTRLLVLLNDLDSITHLNTLLSKEMESYDEFLRLKWGDGIRLFLLRQNSAVMLAALRDTITEIADKVNKCGKARTSDPPKLLWSLIASDKELATQLADLKAIVDSKDFQEIYGALCLVRDKIGAHVDLDILKRNTKRVAAQHDFDYGIMARYEQSSSFRAFFVDDILSMAWKTEGVKSPARDGEQIKPYVQYIVALKRDLAGFSFSLVDRYVRHFGLEVDKQTYVRIVKDVQEFDNKIDPRDKQGKIGEEKPCQ